MPCNKAAVPPCYLFVSQLVVLPLSLQRWLISCLKLPLVLLQRCNSSKRCEVPPPTPQPCPDPTNHCDASCACPTDQVRAGMPASWWRVRLHCSVRRLLAQGPCSPKSTLPAGMQSTPGLRALDILLIYSPPNLSRYARRATSKASPLTAASTAPPGPATPPTV